MNLVERVKAILLSPKTEWPVIEREPGDVSYLFSNYVAILAAIPAVCSFIGLSLMGVGPFRIPIGTGIVNAIVTYVLTFVIIYVVALIVNELASVFGGQKNFDNALKLTVYSYTPSWLVGIFLLIPALSILGLLGLYGLYLFYVGLPVLMKSPQDKSLIYTVAIVVCVIVISVVIGLIQAALFGMPRIM